jgi:hypothetical protein
LLVFTRFYTEIAEKDAHDFFVSGLGAGVPTCHYSLLTPAPLTYSPTPYYFHSPEAPPPPEPTWEEQQTSVLHLVGDNFRDILKKKKHTLVMFYAPCK